MPDDGVPSPRTCPICHESAAVAYESRIDEALVNDFTFASRKLPELMHYEYRECVNCRLLFTSEIPDENELLAAYQQASFDASRESEMAAATYVRALRVVLNRGIDSVLDIGCGDGQFLAAVSEQGVSRVSGVEPSPAAAVGAPDWLRDHIYLGGYETYGTDQTVDLVTLFQTIEHIRDPIGFLVDAQRFISPGGYIAVACHDYTALPNRLMGEKSPIFDIEHLQVFSRQSIVKAMTKAGLHVGYARPYANAYPLSYWMRLAPLPGSLKRSSIVDNSVVDRLTLRLNVGNVMAIGQVRG